MSKAEPEEVIQVALENVLGFARRAVTDPMFADHESTCRCSVCDLMKIIQIYDKLVSEAERSRARKASAGEGSGS